MEGGKKEGLGTGQWVGRPVSLDWANRTLGESWSVALVVKLRGQNIHD